MFDINSANISKFVTNTTGITLITSQIVWIDVLYLQYLKTHMKNNIRMNKTDELKKALFFLCITGTMFNEITSYIDKEEDYLVLPSF